MFINYYTIGFMKKESINAFYSLAIGFNVNGICFILHLHNLIL